MLTILIQFCRRFPGSYGPGIDNGQHGHVIKISACERDPADSRRVIPQSTVITMRIQITVRRVNMDSFLF
jgi:hypothetical protein